MSARDPSRAAIVAGAIEEREVRGIEAWASRLAGARSAPAPRLGLLPLHEPVLKLGVDALKLPRERFEPLLGLIGGDGVVPLPLVFGGQGLISHAQESRPTASPLAGRGGSGPMLARPAPDRRAEHSGEACGSYNFGIPQPAERAGWP